MAKVRNALMTKVAALLLSFVLLLGMVPVGVITAFAIADENYGTLSSITPNGIVTDATGSDAVATFDQVELEWSEADPSIGRTVDGWWVGIKMAAPTNMTKEADFMNVTYQRCTSAVNDTWTDAISFWNAQDSDKTADNTERYLTMWGIVNEQYLNDAIINNTTINFFWKFDWDADGVYEQKASLKIDPSDIVLKKAGEKIYPSENSASVEIISDGLSVIDNASNYVVVETTADMVLDWIAANAEVGRTSDGWWIGYNTIVPAGISAENLASAKFQYKTSSGWDTPKSVSGTDGVMDTANSFQVWRLITPEYLKSAIANNKNINFITRYDWDGDNVYEQVVHLKIVPTMVTLEKDDVQVYPDLGHVTTITGGTVSGSKTGEVIVDASNITLNWSPKDVSIGRYTDGWWAGILITAPEDVVLTESNDVKYQSKTGTNDWSNVKSFYKNQDSAKDAATHYMQLWTVLDREKITENEKVTAQWRFDWDKDGIYEQIVTLNVDSATVTLNRLDRTDFVFEESATDLEVWIGDGTYKNEAASILAPGKVTYAIDDSSTADATVDAETGIITLNSVGTVKVNATIAETDIYNAKTISFAFKVVKNQSEGLKFAVTEPSSIIYSENAAFENIAYDPVATGAITYSIIKHVSLDGTELDATTDPVATIDEHGKLSIKRSGRVTVRAVRAEDDKYLKDDETYTLTINKADQTGFNFATSSPSELTYSTTPYDTVKVEGGQVENTEITYAITSGNEVAEVVNGDKINTLKSGNFILSVTKGGNDCYNPVTVTREMKVTAAEQTTFAFTYPTPSSITYNENGNKYENVAIGGESTGEVTYKVVEGNDVADFANSEKPAELTIKKAGTVKVEATKAADDKYAAKTISYEITVERAEQAFTFADGATVVKNYGIHEYTNTVVSTVVSSKADGVGHGEGTFSYSIEENDIGASINPTTGKITFSDSTEKVGKVKITVTREEDEKYKSCSNEYTIEIKYPVVPAVAYSIDKTVNANYWYDNDIKISAPEGYTVAYDNELSTTEWASYVMYSTEGTICPVIYLKAENGDITDAITVDGYQMDKSVPANLSVGYDITIWETILEKVFGFAPEKATVTLKAEDSVSGIDYVWYSLDNGTTYPESQKVNPVNGEYSFEIPAEFRNIIEFKAVDMAGNTTKYSDGKTVIVDSVAPNLDFEYEHFGLNREVNDIIYANGDVKVNFTLTAANFDLSVAPVVKINENVQSVEWNSDGNTHTASVSLTTTGDYIVTLDFVDHLGRTETYSKNIHVDKVAPVISVFEFTPGEVKDTVSKRNYYDTDQTVTVSITEHNFDPSFVNLEVEADRTSVDTAKFADDYKKISAWTPGTDDTWIAEIPFDNDANYTVKLSYTDLAGNAQTSDAYEFTVDTTDPGKPTIKLDKAVLAKVVETLTFGFYQAPVEVTVTSSDITAGVKEIKYSYVGQKGEYNEAVVNIGETIATDDDTIKFTIPSDTEFKGVISATAYDWSHNASDEQNVSYDANGEELDVIVIDNINPERTVLLTEANRVVDATTLKDISNYNYTKENTNSILYYNDKATLTFIIDEANFFSEDVHVYVNETETNPTDWAFVNNKWQGTITLSEEGDYIVTMEYTDKSSNKMNSYKSEKIVIDKTAPDISVEYHNKNAINTIDGREYYDAAQTATITVKEHNFRADDFKVKVYAKDIIGNNVLTVDENGYIKAYAENGAKRSEWTDYSADWRRVDDTYQLSITYSADANYTFDAEYTDLANNADISDVHKEFTVDTTSAHDLNIKYSTNFVDKILSSIFFYNQKATVEISAKDDVAGIECFNINVKKDGLTEASNIELPEGLVVNADGTVKAGTKGFIDKIASVKEKGGVALSFEVPAQFRGEFIIESVIDLSHNKSAAYNDSNIVAVDTISPDVKVEFAGSLKDKIDADVAGTKPTRQTKEKTDSTTRFVYDGDITATITVKEANFYDDMAITVYRDGAVVTDSVISDWTQVNGTYEYVKTVKLSKDGDYQIQLDYADKSDNKMDVDATGEYAENTAEKVGTYTSNIHTIDTTIPTYSITYDNNTVIQAIDGRDYFNANRTATIQVTDRNFRPNEIDFTVVAKDINNADVKEYTYSKLTSLSDWTQEGNTWTATVPFTTDANYTVNFTYTDIAGHKVEEDYSKLFTVDKVDPNNLEIKYIEPSFVEKVIETATFHFYKAPVKVEISATDDIAGVYHFMYSYAKSDGVSAVNAELIDEAIINANIIYSGNKATASFTIPKEALADNNQFRGNVAFIAYDRSKNNDDTKDPTVVVVDNIAPQIDVAYTANDAKTERRYVDGDIKDVDDFKFATQAFYNGDVTAKITINEANFFEGKAYTDDNGNPVGIVHEVGILLTKTDNNGVVTKTEFMPAGSAQMFASVTSNKQNIDWTSNGDIHTFEIDYDENADYVLTVKYIDFSTNEAEIDANDGKSVVKLYESKIITVDKIDPVIKVDYSNTDVKNTINGRKYFDKQQMATITVTEHNFRADDVDVDVIAKNVIDEDISVADFDAQLRNRDNWKHYDEEGNAVDKAADGNVHVATITYSVDANYTFDIAYTDLAKRAAEDYIADLLTVDKTEPTNLKVSYSEPKLWDTILESIIFGFYNAQMEVTITADDITTGIYHFKYSYIKSEGVSDVNAELIDQAIAAADITYSGASATAKFNIPKLVLKNDNQFNGTVVFTAYDRAENNTDMADEERIVVDNIKPTSQVTFNEPVQNENGISYYAGDINATILINEANFYSKDVHVSVTKDGVNYPVTVQWQDNSVDVHTGTFILTEDGDYIVTVKYADRSTNEMDTYESNRLTIDTKVPTVSVSNIMNNSANKDEIYGFTITANDINIDMNSIKPVLTAVVREEDGNYSTKTIPLGDIKTVEAGKTYSFTVDNLEEDAVYTLICTLKDMSGNAYSKIVLSDGKEYDSVKFSINRDGSTFAVNEATDKLVSQYYVYSVVEDIIIEEINVDPIENYIVKLNGEVLTEGKDYTTTITDNDGEWSKRTYVIKKSLFENEGEYNIIVESVDKAETTAYSDIKNLKVAFVVDQTAPILTISGLEQGGRYQIDEQIVTVIPTDDGGKLNSFKAILLDSNGNEIEVLFEMFGDEFIKYLEENDGKITFTVPEGLEHQVRIICTDCAVNVDGTTNAYDQTFTKVTVSKSGWVIYYANKPLFYGSIVGVLLLVGGIIFLIVYKKRKKEEEQK